MTILIGVLTGIALGLAISTILKAIFKWKTPKLAIPQLSIPHLLRVNTAGQYDGCDCDQCIESLSDYTREAVLARRQAREEAERAAQEQALRLFYSFLTDEERAECKRSGSIALSEDNNIWVISPETSGTTSLLQHNEGSIYHDPKGRIYHIYHDVCVQAPWGTFIPQADIAATLLLHYRAGGSEQLRKVLAGAPGLNQEDE